jgi:hypothetical protein
MRETKTILVTREVGSMDRFIDTKELKRLSLVSGTATSFENHFSKSFNHSE